MKYIKTVVSKRVPTALAVALAVTSMAYVTGLHAASLEGTSHEGETHNGSEKLAIAPIVFRDGATHMRVLDNIDGIAISEGDIIFGDADAYFNNKSRNRSVLGLSNYVYGTVWPNGVVPYRISGKLSDSAKGKVRAAIEAWNNTGAISLIERTQATEAAYPNYIDFVDASQCASWVGFQDSGAQSIYTGDKCSEGSMIHEIGHALGLLHEHTRPDRDSFVQVNWNNINPEKNHNFDILGDAIVLGDYDYDSIMHYGSHFFSNNGSATITPLHGNVGKIGQRQYISDGDEASVVELYQSDYALITTATPSAIAGEAIQLDMYVTNNSDMGANSMQLETAVPAGTSLISFSSPSWVCQQGGEGENVICLSPVLTQSASSNVSISLTAPTTNGEVTFDTTLNANTFDTNPSDNRDNSSTLVVSTVDDLLEEEVPAPVAPQPAFAAATPAPVAAAATPAPVAAAATPAATKVTASSAGGGSFGSLGLLLLLARRRAR